MIETHRSFANRWECDENGHINVQFYYRWFDEAAQVFALLNHHDPALGNALISRHVRYYKELHDGDGTKIISGVVKSGDFAGRIVHLLYNSNTNEIAATALDQPTEPVTGNHFADLEKANIAFPRGLEDGQISALDIEPLLKNGKAIVSNYSVVTSAELTDVGQFITNRIISRFTDGAPHIWDHAGVTTQWLNQTGNGRVAVEMKLCPISAPKVGDVLRLVSYVSDVSGKTMQIDHQLENLKTKSIVALGSVRCLVMNLTTRRAGTLPEGIKGS